MNTVLVDASTALFTSQLLTGESAPNAINVLDLASLIDTVVLNEKVLLLDTSGQKADTLDALNAVLSTPLGSVFDIKQVSTDEILTSLQRDRSTDGGELLPFGDFLIDLKSLGKPGDSYLSWLQQVYDYYWPANRPGRRIPAAAANLHFQYMARRVLKSGHLPPTVFNQWLEGEGRQFSRLAVGGVLRCQLYLAAGELYQLPYKPDMLRWPLVWRLMQGKGSRERLLGQTLIELAEKAEAKQAEDVTDTLGVSLVTPMPLLLRHVLRRARSRDDIIAVCMEVRESTSALRFREFVGDVAMQVSQGDVIALNKEIRNYAAAISRATGSADRPEALFAVLGIAADITKAVTGPNIGQILNAGRSSQRLLEKMVQRWRARRFAMITTPLRLRGSMADIQKDLGRIFGAELSDQELTLMAAGRH